MSPLIINWQLPQLLKNGVYVFLLFYLHTYHRKETPQLVGGRNCGRLLPFLRTQGYLHTADDGYIPIAVSPSGVAFPFANAKQAQSLRRKPKEHDIQRFCRRGGDQGGIPDILVARKAQVPKTLGQSRVTMLPPSQAPQFIGGFLTNEFFPDVWFPSFFRLYI